MTSNEKLKFKAKSLIEKIEEALEEWEKDPEDEEKRRKVEELSVFLKCHD